MRLSQPVSARPTGCPDPTWCRSERLHDRRRVPLDPVGALFDLTARFNATDNMTFTATVQNLFDNQPKVVGNTIGSTTFNSGKRLPVDLRRLWDAVTRSAQS
jgi:outer membrane receptor for ferrienterochelin and colicin